jgi:hypothetical protein
MSKLNRTRERLVEHEPARSKPREELKTQRFRTKVHLTKRTVRERCEVLAGEERNALAPKYMLEYVLLHEGEFAHDKRLHYEVITIRWKDATIGNFLDYTDKFSTSLLLNDMDSDGALISSATAYMLKKFLMSLISLTS